MPLEGFAGSSGRGRREHNTLQGNIRIHEVGLSHDPGRAPLRGVAALVTPKTCNTRSLQSPAIVQIYLQECEDLLLITSFMLSAPESSSSSVKRPARGAPGLPWIRISVKNPWFKNIPWQGDMFARSMKCMTQSKYIQGNMQGFDKRCVFGQKSASGAT